MKNPFDNETERSCDGCDGKFSESLMRSATYRYVDESWETFHFCPSCTARDRKLDEEAYLRSPHLW